jgi:phosphoribosylglycinamide formyltransferase-1
MARKIRIGALISGGGTNFQAIFKACQSGQVDADVAFVGADNLDAEGLIFASENRIPTFVIDYRAIGRELDPHCCHEEIDETAKQFFSDPEQLLLCMEKSRKIIPKTNKTGWQDWLDKRWFLKRVAAEKALLEKINEIPIDLLVLAGFMRYLSSFIIDRFSPDQLKPRIMNIHPALLPSFPGTDGYGDTIRYGCKVGGCTVHFVDYGEDSGPIIGQRSYDILPDDTEDTIRKRGLNLEWELYPKCIQLFAEGRFEVVNQTQRDGSTRKVVKIFDLYPGLSKVKLETHNSPTTVIR